MQAPVAPPEGPVLQGRRIHLRPLRFSDADDLQQYANDPSIARNTTVPYPYTLDHARAFIRRTHQQIRGGRALPLAICLTDDAFIGMCSLVNIDRAAGEAEVGYWIGRPFRRQGYTTEAVRLLSQYAFETLGLRRLYAGVLPHNTASAKVLLNVGFRYFGPTYRRDLPHERLDGYERVR